MCGIAGFVQLSRCFRERELALMTDAVRRRGPDDAGHYLGEDVGLGMRRLSIIDIEGGRQPVFSQSGRFVAVFNGEIYNYRELQSQLRNCGFSFKSNGDAEVIVNLYERYGTEAFNQLRGMFAVAIWDSQEKELLLVRDQLGIKPLFYSDRGGALLFGSEIKSILAAVPGLLAIDAEALDAFFAYTYIPAPLSIWKDIRKLKPGHFLRWREGKLSIHQYWDLLDTDGAKELSVSELRDALDESVRAHLVSDVEVGAFLSGGLDSSTIVARMQEAMDSSIQAYSVRFQTKSHLFDETGFAEELRDRYKFRLHIETLPASEYDVVADAIRAFDEPFADDSIVPNYAICAIAARRLKVVLSGAGGDEFFGGYNRYQGVAAQQYLDVLPRWAKRGLVSPALGLLSHALGSGSRKADLVKRFSTNLGSSTDDAYLAYVTAAPAKTRARLLGAAISGIADPSATRGLVGDHLKRAAGIAPVKRAMYADVKTYLPEDVLALSDRIGMWHSLEIRTPLADRVLAEAAFRLSSCQLVGLKEKKVALRRAVAPWLPESILSHPKQGFEGPTASWLREEGSVTLRNILSRHRASGLGLLQCDFVDTLLKQHIDGQADHAKCLFSAYTLAVWADLYRERISGVA